jgi:glycosyltransferase involved in cell wall biosynthesis
MDFTVIICTFNRSANLPTCLAGLARQDGVRHLDWEVLVVDNNSSDDTSQVVERLATTLPIKIRYAFESEQGLNYARNRGARESDSRFFAFLDDDILASEGWLHAVHQALLTNDADAVGGRIHLDPALRLPGWIAPEMRGFLGYQDYGDEPFRMDGLSRYPFGGNMSFERRVVERVGLFNPKLGRKGAGQRRGELFKGAETDFFNRLAADPEARIFYEPRAIVYHHVLPHQLTKRYFRTIHYNAGYQAARFDDKAYPRRFVGVPLFLFSQLARGIWRYVVQLVREGSDVAFRQQMTVGHFVGMVMGYASKRASVSGARSDSARSG